MSIESISPSDLSDYLTPHFRLAELACRDGTPVPAELRGNARAICERAEVLREVIGRAVIVTSGYRTPAHNARVGGARSSAHLTASALDLRCAGLPAEQLAAVYRQLVASCRIPDGGLGVYPRPGGGWIHIDLGRPRRWRG